MPEVMEIQATLEAAVQEQPAGMVTVTEPVAPAAANAGGAAERVALHTGAAPFWVMAKVSPAMVKEPEREVVPVLAATE